MRARLTSRHLVGRVGELAELELALREAADRHPVLVLLGGESGVGKTRLVAEFEQGVSGKGALVLRGESLEQGDGELPYAGLVGALRPLVRERHPALDALSPSSRTQLAALLPGLSEGRQPSDAHGPAGQLRLFEAVLELVDLLGEATPVVLVLEDLHWADRSTRAFVAFLARSVRQERVLLLLTYRSDELHRRHPLRPLLSELERLERARRIELEPFDRGELVEALADILGDRPGEPLVARLFARSEGNPLYIEELLAAGLDGRGAAPQSLRDAFMLRIERLPEDAQRAARAIAAGRRLDEPVIAQLTGIEPDALHVALRDAVAEQVLIAGEDGRLGFRHALLREAVYDDLLPGERAELHLALARAFDAEAAGEDRQPELAATIAHHYAMAGDQPAALRATVRAALAARAVHAYGEAADLAERALQLWPRVPDTAQVVDLDHVDLLRLAAAAHGVAGDRTRAEVLLESALSELDRDAEPRRYATVLARLARVRWSLNRGIEGVETAQRALALLPAEEPSRERASLLSWLARTRHLRGRFRDALVDAEKALVATVAAGDRCSEGEVLNTLGMTRIVLGEIEDGIASLRKAIEIAREDDELDDLATAYSNLADSLNLIGRTAEALETAREGLAATPARVTRSHDWMMLTVSELSFEIGDWKAARDELASPASKMAGVVLIFRQLREAELALGIGDDELAANDLREVEPLVASSSEPQWIGTFGALLGELRRRSRDLESAREAVMRALDRIELCTDDVMRIARVSAVGARVEADIAQRARDLREKGQERDAVARARIHLQRLRAAAKEGGPVEKAWLATGAGDLARARGRNDPKLWSKAAAEWDSLSRPFQAAIARWRAAEAYVETGDRAAAAERARDALRVARRLGSRWLSDEVTALAERARLETADGATSPPARDSSSDNGHEDPFGLTPRERQVLALLAEGATNRQIGAALFMAEKTASVHVSRILSKLGVRSRTQAAAVAHRQRLGR
jgi:DNA-binding CsgD family transcriptional regulator